MCAGLVLLHQSIRDSQLTHLGEPFLVGARKEAPCEAVDRSWQFWWKLSCKFGWKHVLLRVIKSKTQKGYRFVRVE